MSHNKNLKRSSKNWKLVKFFSVLDILVKVTNHVCDNSVLLTIQFWGDFSTGDISVLMTFQFWWYFIFGDISVLWNFSFGYISLLGTLLVQWPIEFSFQKDFFYFFLLLFFSTFRWNYIFSRRYLFVLKGNYVPSKTFGQPNKKKGLVLWSPQTVSPNSAQLGIISALVLD